jgi:class 3 adenylate cyclase/TolB-like protein
MARDQRRLAAIVSADVAGYSRLMGRDDSGTLAALKAHRHYLIDPKIAEYGGRIVKTTGDGLLLEFPSVVEAVRCAVDVHRGMAERNAIVPADQRLDFRIGINLGDIIIDGDDIYGDGVNVAARLQALAEPGEICVSKVVRDQVLDKLSFSFDELGAQQVKNIARPVEVYRVDLGSNTLRPQPRTRWTRFARAVGWRWVAAGVIASGVAVMMVWAWPRLWNPTAVDSPPVMSVAVFPIVAPGGDADAARVAETLTRSLMTELPRKREYGSVYVVSGNSLAARATGSLEPREVGRRLNVRYTLEGDVSRRGSGNTADLRLFDAMTGGLVWSERTVLEDADLAVQSSAALRGLGLRLRALLIGNEGRRVTALPLSALSARELVLRAFELGGKDASLAGRQAAGKLAEDALRREPDLVPALVLRSAIINSVASLDPHSDRGRIVREEDQLTARAVRLDATDPAAWNWRGVALAGLGRQDAALDAIAMAIKLDPYEARWQNFRAGILIGAGRPEEALTVVDQALALNPSNVGGLMSTACEAHLLIGEIDQAIATCEKASALTNEVFVQVMLAAAYANHGDVPKGAAAKADVLRASPEFTIALARQQHVNDPEYVRLAEKYLYGGLRKAGFAEQ